MPQAVGGKRCFSPCSSASLLLGAGISEKNRVVRMETREGWTQGMGGHRLRMDMRERRTWAEVMDGHKVRMDEPVTLPPATAKAVCE